MRSTQRLLSGQGAFYLVAGLWPIFHLKSFKWVTGPKPEGWLVKTIGGLIAVCGAAYLAARKDPPTLPIIIVGIGVPAVLGGAAGWYAAMRRISPVYFLDAAAEALIIGGWVRALRGERSPVRQDVPAATHSSADTVVLH